MSAPFSRSSLSLLAVGAVAILLLGAFSPLQQGGVPVAAPPAPRAANPEDAAATQANESELPVGLSPGLAEIVKLARADVGDSTLLAFIRNSGQSYSPSAEEVLYLANLGISQTVIAALFPEKPSAAPIASDPTPPAAAVGLTSLAPQSLSTYLPPAAEIPAGNFSQQLVVLPPLEEPCYAQPNPSGPTLPVLFLLPSYPVGHPSYHKQTISPSARAVYLESPGRGETPRHEPKIEPPALPPLLSMIRPVIAAASVNSKSGK